MSDGTDKKYVQFIFHYYNVQSEPFEMYPTIVTEFFDPDLIGSRCFNDTRIGPLCFNPFDNDQRSEIGYLTKSETGEVRFVPYENRIESMSERRLVEGESLKRRLSKSREVTLTMNQRIVVDAKCGKTCEIRLCKQKKRDFVERNMGDKTLTEIYAKKPEYAQEEAL